MPPTNQVPPGGFGRPLAELTDTFYHYQVKQLLVRLQTHPIVIVQSQYHGIGKSHAIRQACEQMVQAKQVVFLPSAYVSGGLSPSLLYAYQHGGTVVISDGGYSNLELSLHFANHLLSNNPCIGLDQPTRGEMHADFHYVIEMIVPDGHSYTNPLLVNPALRALQLQFSPDDYLSTQLRQQLYTTQAANDAVLHVLGNLGTAESYNLHLITLLQRFSAEERLECLRELLLEYKGAGEHTFSTYLEGKLDILAKAKVGKMPVPKSIHKAAQVAETDTMEEQQQHLVEVVQLHEDPTTPTVQPATDPVAGVIATGFGF
jgi:hypothetical protein